MRNENALSKLRSHLLIDGHLQLRDCSRDSLINRESALRQIVEITDAHIARLRAFKCVPDRWSEPGSYRRRFSLLSEWHSMSRCSIMGVQPLFFPGTLQLGDLDEDT